MDATFDLCLKRHGVTKDGVPTCDIVPFAYELDSIDEARETWVTVAAVKGCIFDGFEIRHSITGEVVYVGDYITDEC